MKSRAILSMFIFSFFGCTYTNKPNKEQVDSLNIGTNRKHLHRTDSSSLTIYKTYFVLSLQGQKQKVNTTEQLSKLINSDYNRKDSLYILIGETFNSRIDDAMKVLHNSNVDKYIIVVTPSFFKLPYPDQH